MKIIQIAVATSHLGNDSLYALGDDGSLYAGCITWDGLQAAWVQLETPTSRNIRGFMAALEEDRTPQTKFPQTRLKP